MYGCVGGWVDVWDEKEGRHSLDLRKTNLYCVTRSALSEVEPCLGLPTAWAGPRLTCTGVRPDTRDRNPIRIGQHSHIPTDEKPLLISRSTDGVHADSRNVYTQGHMSTVVRRTHSRPHWDSQTSVLRTRVHTDIDYTPTHNGLTP